MQTRVGGFLWRCASRVTPAWMVLWMLGGGAASPTSAQETPAVIELSDAAAPGAPDPLQDGGEPPKNLSPAPAPPPGRFGPLPPVHPNSNVAPLLSGRPQNGPARPTQVAPEERPGAVLKVVVGMLALLALAYLGGHPRVRAWEAKLGITQVVTAGLPFLLLGTVARLPGVDVLNAPVLADLGPVLRLGLGLIGFAAGLRFDARLFGQLPEAVVRGVAVNTLLPFAFVALSTGLALGWVLPLEGGDTFGNPIFLRDALILGTAGAITATSATLLLPTHAPDEARRLTTTLVRLEEVAGIGGLAVVAAYFRPGGTASWQLPGTAWLLVTLGLGLVVGMLGLLILQRARAEAEFILFTLGLVSFGAGLAGQLNLSSVVVCFLVGALLGNLSQEHQQRLSRALGRLERPVYLLFLAVVGALWDVGGWVGWLLLPVFVVSRLLGKWLATQVRFEETLILQDSTIRRALTAAPMGSLAVAIVVDAHQLYPGGAIAPITSAVVGGMLVTEGLVQFLLRALPSGEQA